MTMFDVPVNATFTPPEGDREYVQIIGSDLSRSIYRGNVFLIRRATGATLVTSEAWLR